MTPNEVARIVEHKSEPEFVELLRATDAEFDRFGFEAELGTVFRDEPQLVAAWESWSEDQRWTPSAWLAGVRCGWVTPEGTIVYVREHPDRAAATAEFVRRLAAWLNRRTVVYAN